MDMSRRALLGATTAGIVLAACGCGNASGDAELNALLDRISHRIPARVAGVRDRAWRLRRAGWRPLHRSPERRLGEEAKARNLAIAEQALSRICAPSTATASSAQGKVSYDVVATALRTTDRRGSLRFWRRRAIAVRAHAAHAALTPACRISSRASIRSPTATRPTLTHAAVGLRRKLDQEIAVINADVGAGVIPPDFCIDRPRLGQQCAAFARVIAPAPEPCWCNAFARRLPDVAEISAADDAALSQRAETIVRDEVCPAYQRQIDALNADAAARHRTTPASGSCRKARKCTLAALTQQHDDVHDRRRNPQYGPRTDARTARRKWKRSSAPRA